MQLQCFIIQGVLQNIEPFFARFLATLFQLLYIRKDMEVVDQLLGPKTYKKKMYARNDIKISMDFWKC